MSLALHETGYGADLFRTQIPKFLVLLERIASALEAQNLGSVTVTVDEEDQSHAPDCSSRVHTAVECDCEVSRG